MGDGEKRGKLFRLTLPRTSTFESSKPAVQPLIALKQSRQSCTTVAKLSLNLPINQHRLFPLTSFSFQDAPRLPCKELEANITTSKASSRKPLHLLPSFRPLSTFRNQTFSVSLSSLPSPAPKQSIRRAVAESDRYLDEKSAELVARSRVQGSLAFVPSLAALRSSASQFSSTKRQLDLLYEVVSRWCSRGYRAVGTLLSSFDLFPFASEELPASVSALVA